MLRARSKRAFSANFYVRLSGCREWIAPGTVKSTKDWVGLGVVGVCGVGGELGRSRTYFLRVDAAFFKFRYTGVGSYATFCSIGKGSSSSRPIQLKSKQRDFYCFVVLKISKTPTTNPDGVEQSDFK